MYGKSLNNGYGVSLSDKMKPESFDDIIGQDHLVSKDAVLRKVIESGVFDSLIFIGPPGVGKTSLAKLIGELLFMPFYSLHSTTAGANDLKKISDMASSSSSSVLVFIDEIHRYSKTQQITLLKMIDDGFVRLISASTENPAYSLVPALRSRSLMFNFNKLCLQDFLMLALKASNILKINYDVSNVEYESVLDDLAKESGGDARRFLKLFELAAMMGDKHGDTLTLSVSRLDGMVRRSAFNDDEYYDLLSAMIKSIRGSDPDASLLWGLKLVRSGVDPDVVFRRLLISASEDIGNAYPDALVFANSAYGAFTNVGLPEGMIILSHLITFLATCPKSNRSYLALKHAEKYLDRNDPEVPKNISHNHENYKYPHDYGGFIKQIYKPDDVKFYEPSENGFEHKILERLKRLWNE